jgi:hypothetical protein
MLAARAIEILSIIANTAVIIAVAAVAITTI